MAEAPDPRQLQRLLHSIPDMVCVADFEGFFRWINPRFEAVLGWTEADLMARPFLEFVHPDDVQATLDEMASLEEGADTLRFTNRYRCGDGGFRWLEWNATPDQEAGLIYAIARDVSDLRPDKGRLRALQDRRAALFYAVPDLLLLLRRDGTTLDFFAPEELRGLVGGERLIGGRLQDTLPAPLGSLLLEAIARALDGRRMEIIEEELQSSEGVRHLEVRIVPSGEDEVLALARDVTGRVEDQRRLEAQSSTLRRKNEDLERYAYVVSHDLQAPLRKVVGYLEILQRRAAGRLDERAGRYVEMAIEGGQQMQALISDLLAFSRLRALPEVARDPVSVDEALDRALDNLEVALRESGAAVRRGPLPTLRAEPLQLALLLQNLVENAIKYRGEAAPEIRVEATAGEGDWTLAVTDNGVGVAPRFQAMIFEPFRRAHHGTPGTGVGLAICREIARRHGGDIQVESRAGEGSTFFVTWPA